MKDGLGLGISVGEPVAGHSTQLNVIIADVEDPLRPAL